jgi:hypothetical protein
MLQFVFRQIHIRQLVGESRIGAEEILNVAVFQSVIFDRPHARIWGQLHANIIAFVKHNSSLEQVNHRSRILEEVR